MTNYYLSTGYGHVYNTGNLKDKVTLPMGGSDIITEGKWHMSDDGFDIDLVVAEQKEKLQDGDTLTIVYSNLHALYISEEDIEEFHIPQNQREELWNSEGIVDTYTYFTDASKEEWSFLVNE